MQLDFLLARERVIKAVRSFFDAQGFHELITPVLNSSIPTEPNVYPFATRWNTIEGEKQLFLATSPEKKLKYWLAQEMGNCYSIGHSFRNLEQTGPKHTPEFLMLEWYRKHATYETIMDDTKRLLAFVAKALGQHTHHQPWQIYSMDTLFQQYVESSIEHLITDKVLIDVAQKKGYQTEQATWEQLFDQLFLNEIEPHLPNISFFLTDFPARISPLCAIQREKPWLAQRFEVYAQGMEIGNGNTEQTDTTIVRQYMEQEREVRIKNGQTVSPLDEEFLSSLQTLHETGKSYAGIGLGIDRLTLMMTNGQQIPSSFFFNL
ncbi:hypothetical protein C5B42_04515 [Candidatus Cerribacteria bacterium 'Amazon FNV 2010 28 9']|uniref:Aminoacyl-transfer RNA synthetases class-II family profile domain-containing protein n=1 Tax=Candidatus Cerribacteria bacterium 'Amazon FNV 2010 28 9' TaxID=2081795 RepID=A0A317JMT0_9BACT|nr:MAG: hypothetical protein C5B42_04515 [Candidatus Cerribacteria bacterium 'Amazon FNV 2010 28 9']